jgi:hypothetical protein
MRSALAGLVLAIGLISSTAAAEKPYQQIKLGPGDRVALRRLQQEATQYVRTDGGASRLVGLMHQHGLREVHVRDLKNGVHPGSKLVVRLGPLGGLTLREAFEPSRLTNAWYIQPGWVSARFGRWSVTGLRGLTLDEIKTAIRETTEAVAADPKSRTLEKQGPPIVF